MFLRAPNLLVFLLLFCMQAGAANNVSVQNFGAETHTFVNGAIDQPPTLVSNDFCVWSYRDKKRRGTTTYTRRTWRVSRDAGALLFGVNRIGLDMRLDGTEIAEDGESAEQALGYTPNDSSVNAEGCPSLDPNELEFEVVADDWWSQPAGSYTGNMVLEVCATRNNGTCRNKTDSITMTFNVDVPEAVRLVLAATTLDFGTYTSAGTGAGGSPSVNFCTYHRGVTTVGMQLDSNNPTNAIGTTDTFNMLGDGSQGDTLEYSVNLAFYGAVAKSGLAGRLTGIVADSASPTCSAGTNNTVSVTLLGNLDAVQAGAYQDTLTITVSPN